MRLNFKTILLALAIPTGLLSFTLPRNQTENIASHSRPYIVKEILANGEAGQVYRGTSDSTNEFQILSDLGAKPFFEDKYSAFPDIQMGIGSQITLYRAPNVFLADGKRKYEIRSWAKNVAELLREQNIPEIGKDDKINFSLDTEVSDQMSIKIIRVAKTTVMQTAPISYNIIKRPNPNLEKGNNNIITPGVNGTKNLYYLVTRQDGEEVSRALQKTEVVQAPIDEVLEVGTKVVVYGSGKATWYSRIDTMVAAHNTLPKGTKVKVINLTNNKSVVVTIDDRGIQGSAVIDLSDDAFAALAPLGAGVINVRVEKYYPE